ncbi:MAG: metal ABC transporter substrate-binding protein [Dehalococcoidia bacterium]
MAVGLFGLVLVIASLTATACGGDESGGERLRVVTTLELLADFARGVGGDEIEVSALIPAGADPHTFEPSPGDVALISQADIVVANGLNLETATIKLMEANIGSNVQMVKLADEAATRGFELINGDEDRNANPHLWLDPTAVQVYLAILEERLVELAPGKDDRFRQNRRDYTEDLDDATVYLADRAAEVALGRRVLVTTHDAFPYLARAIGFEIGAVVATGPGQEPSPRAVADLTEVIEDRQVPAVFREPQVGPETDVLEQAAADAGVEVCVLLSDAFIGDVESYTGLVRHNADELARCLGG